VNASGIMVVPSDCEVVAMIKDFCCFAVLQLSSSPGVVF
jgi:hypothetical protein